MIATSEDRIVFDTLCTQCAAMKTVSRNRIVIEAVRAKGGAMEADSRDSIAVIEAVAARKSQL